MNPQRLFSKLKKMLAFELFVNKNMQTFIRTKGATQSKKRDSVNNVIVGTTSSTMKLTRFEDGSQRKR